MISAPHRDERTTERRGRISGVLPLIVLAAGLLVVLVVVGADPDITLQRLRDYGSNLYLPQHVGYVYPTFQLPRTDPFSASLDHRPWLETILFCTAYLGATTAIGSPVIAAIRGDDEWPAPVRMLAGFLPGYLMVLAPLQALFNLMPFATASWVALVALPLAAVALHWRRLIAGVRAVRFGVPRRDGVTITVAVALAFVLIALVHRLQQGIFFLTQDSIGYFLKAGVDTLGGVFSYLVHWQNQTDEWVFNAPLLFADGGRNDLWLSFYVTQSVGLAAFLCLLYGAVHRVARRRKALAGALAVAVVFGSTFAIYPWIYALIVGGGQPVLALGHTGRLIGIIAPWCALLIAVTPRRAPVWALALATLGLAFTNLNNVLYVGVAIAAVLIWRLPRRAPDLLGTRMVRAVVHVLLALALALPVVAFSFTSGVPSAPAVPALILVGACLAGLAGAVLIALGTAKRGEAAGSWRLWMWSGAWAGTVVAGLFFSDNLGTSSVGKSAHDLLGHVFPAYNQIVAERTEMTGGAFAGLSFPTFSQQACDSNESCGGIALFLLSYGVLFTLIVAVWVGYGRLRSDARQTNERRAAILLSVAVLPVVLIMVFFTGADTLRSATFTRMLEWPYYSLLVLGVLGFCEARDRRVMIGGVAFLAVWTIVPLISYQWPEQMVRNAGWYLDRLL